MKYSAALLRVTRSSGHSCNLFYSHPNVPLQTHLSSVGALCKSYIERAGIRNGKLIDVAEIIGKCHDLGKYTAYFQRYLSNIRVPRELSTHSRLSALATSWLIKQKFGEDQLAAIGFLCVDSHHGHLKSLESINRLNWTDPVVFKQAKSINDEAVEISDELKAIGIYEVLDLIHNFGAYLHEIRTTLGKACRQLRWEVDEKRQWSNYYKTLMLFSALVDADKRDAGKILESQPLKQIPEGIVTSYREKVFSKASSSKMSILREQIFLDVDKNLSKLVSSGKLPPVFTITAPTGSGKTLLGFHVAVKLREHMPKKPRIIYSLPYINIIEQAYSVYEDVLSSYYGEKPCIDLLLKHHHLALSSYSASEEDLDKQLLLAESWESEIIVTTFEQLLGSIIGCRNSMLKKFHNIANSILLLDEVQAIPLEYWKLIRDVLLNLTNFNVKIILMTATMPAIFQGAELVGNSMRYFRQLTRVNLIPELEKNATPDELADIFLSRWRKGQSALLVLNTIKSSKKVYEAIKNRLNGNVACLGSDKMKNDVVLAYLSTSILPVERKRRIEQIHSLLKAGRSVILVATQVVEAGVDLDFDMAFRDLGPLDSIIQVAGRCNRNWRSASGQVYVIKVVGDDGKFDSHKIYGAILPEVTSGLISSEKCINEGLFLDIMKKYYDEISYRLNAEMHPQSLNILEDLKALDFRALESFSLIEERSKVPVYIEWDKKASNLLASFQNMLNKLQSCDSLEEVFEYKAKLKKLKAEIENYIVETYSSTDIIKSLNQAFKGFNILFVPHNEIEAYYDAETGFREGNGSFVML